MQMLNKYQEESENISHKEKKDNISLAEKLNRISKELNVAWEMFYDIYEINNVEKQRINKLFNKAQHYIQNAFYDNAIDILRHLVEINPQESKYHSHIGLALLRKGLGKIAHIEFENAIKLNDKDPVAIKYFQTNDLLIIQNSKPKAKKGYSVLPWKIKNTVMNKLSLFSKTKE